ncbi:MAG: homoserine O-acetyltransferase [Bacteroidota bacterium]
MNLKYFKYHHPFDLEIGEVLPEITVAYTTFGELNASKSNVIWVCHALTGSADVAEWWSGLVGEGKLFDPTEHFIICANVLGSHYGSTSALSINPKFGTPYFHDFPFISIRDIVKSFKLLCNHLKINKINTCIGGSLGGQQAIEMAIMYPDLVENLILIATNAQFSPWGIAFNETQRMAIAADPTWQNNDENAGRDGLKIARAVALLSYRNYQTYSITQQRSDEPLDRKFRAATYQHYQGEKLVSRFNAFSYWTLTCIMDSHDVGRGRGEVKEVLQTIKAKTLVLGIESDVLFPINEQQFLAQHIPNARLEIIDSLYGHDGFLIENQLLTKVIRTWQSNNGKLVEPLENYFKSLDKVLV